MDPLSELEVRVLGALMEKQVTTPDLYPLSLNALTNACNQKNSRSPVTSYSDREVEAALDGLKLKGLASFTRESGGRVPKYMQFLARELNLIPEQHAVLCLLMLRGAQTVGELRGRTEPLHKFESLSDVERVLEKFAYLEIAVKLERSPGERDARWTHLLTGAPILPVAGEGRPSSGGGIDLVSRVEALEAEVLALRAELEVLKSR
ncbi:MAG: DUF480 domain-containing protein [Pleurocapsa sp. SU_196_0]|nr:DUF480 domain-containing protein [Pleurocapsa sp. SU_196_0]